MVTRRRSGIDRDSYSAVFPCTSWTHCATGTVGHRQVILRPEGGCVGLVGSWSNCVRDRSATGPTAPDVANARATALGRSRANRVA